jgi:hypothetical protein
MSKQSLDQIIQRASSDARFRSSLGENFEGALRSYDLTGPEKIQLARAIGISVSGAAQAMPEMTAASHVEANSLEAMSHNAMSIEAGSLEAGSLEAGSLEAGSLEATSHQTE